MFGEESMPWMLAQERDSSEVIIPSPQPRSRMWSAGVSIVA